MNSVARELLDLLYLGGIAMNEARSVLADGSVDVRTNIQTPARLVEAHRTTSGLITIPVKPTECLAITRIAAYNIDYSATATFAVSNSTNSVAENPIQLVAVVGEPTLYVFPPGNAIFNLVFTAQPTVTGSVGVHGYRLPKAALNKLSLIATEELRF